MFAFSQTAVPSDSVGVGVIAQQERHTPLSALQCSQKTRGNSGENQRFISSEAEPSSAQAVPTSISHG